MPAQRVERAVRMGRSTISSLAVTGFLTIGAASAAHDQQAKAIYTASQFGAYHSSFCPPIVVILESAGVHGYSCTPSGGTLDNIAKVLADPPSLGFVQLDILARWALDNIEAAKKLVVIRTVACEGLCLTPSRRHQLSPIALINVDINGYVRGVEVVEQIDDVIDCGAKPCRSVVIVCAGDDNDMHGRSSSKAVGRLFSFVQASMRHTLWTHCRSHHQHRPFVTFPTECIFWTTLNSVAFPEKASFFGRVCYISMIP
jgi:hypothetical protein